MDGIDIDNTLAIWMGKTAKMTKMYIEEKLKNHHLDITKEQLFLLNVLHAKDGVPQNDIACITSRNKASVARLINNMEKKNLVARIPDTDDKRINRIYLTKNGMKVFEKTVPLLNELFLKLQEGLSKEEIQTTIQIIKKVQNNLKSNSVSCNKN